MADQQPLFYATFGCRYNLANSLMRIPADDEMSARQTVSEFYDNRYCDVVNQKEADEQAVKFGLHTVPFGVTQIDNEADTPDHSPEVKYLQDRAVKGRYSDCLGHTDDHLVWMGCGDPEDPQWVIGLAEMARDGGILVNAPDNLLEIFKKVFWIESKKGGVSIVFQFNMKYIDSGKFMMWRLRCDGLKWMSDFCSAHQLDY